MTRRKAITGSGASSSAIGSPTASGDAVHDQTVGVNVRRTAGKVALFQDVDAPEAYAPTVIPEYRWLRNTLTDAVTKHHRADAKEILLSAGSIYEPAEAPEGE